VTISVFELFKVGIGPSSSHTVGPMRAAADFVAQLEAIGVLARVVDVRVEMYGSLAATGRGHGTLPAVLLGLEGHRPETIESEEMESGRERLRSTGKILLGGRVPIALSEDDIALYTRTVLDFHPNGMTMIATAADDTMLYRQTYFSVGGGFVVTEEEAAGADSVTAGEGDTSFSSAAQLLALASGTGRTASSAASAAPGCCLASCRCVVAQGSGTTASIRKTHTVIRGSPRIGSTWSRLLSTRRTRPAVAS
jgi:L-serine dehydratase